MSVNLGAGGNNTKRLEKGREGSIPSSAATKYDQDPWPPGLVWSVELKTGWTGSISSCASTTMLV
ncbi:hypothetical protein CFAM422_010231 [Trichoderma lentiforme]|uniref:Uncharacterized protein n=1 Tax=Trichoderma lentiforme TaxID=1567552 RepID=A0A9P4X8K2_9HYPO|nr:hypothetical protein CFAM422_010231 [Trichoderma lentiforme]